MCSYVGESRDFVHGCPNCGYAGGSTEREVGFEQVDYTPPARSIAKQRAPGWVWPLAIGILLVVFAGLIVVYLSL